MEDRIKELESRVDDISIALLEFGKLIDSNFNHAKDINDKNSDIILGMFQKFYGLITINQLKIDIFLPLILQIIEELEQDKLDKIIIYYNDIKKKRLESILLDVTLTSDQKIEITKSFNDINLSDFLRKI